jgi:DDE_Tnp_1-associated
MDSQSAMPAADAASTVIDFLSARMGDVPASGEEAGKLPGLLEFLAQVPDRRRVRGRRHRLAAILALACAAVAAGSRSLTAIAEWAAAAPAAVLAAFGVRRDPRAESWVVPSETTIRRALNKVDADALDAQVSAWLLALAGYGGEQYPGEAMVVAVDGKTARGARQAGGTAPHFLAAITCAETAVIAQQQVDAKSNECA